MTVAPSAIPDVIPLPDRNPVIHLDQLTIRYGKFTAVDRLNLQIYPGELFGLLGPNGAGKTTTIRVLIGQRKPSDGKVSVCGHDVVRAWATIKRLFGYVPDRENHFEEFTGRRNLELFAGLYNVPRERVEKCLAMVELTDAADTRVQGYSLGMRRKLLLARALLHEPPVLYLDEPTANLDIHSAELVHRILRGIVAAGTTVLLTTHNMKEVEAICDRVAILCKGRLVALDAPLTLQRQHAERLVDVVLGDGRRLVVNLDLEGQREELARHVQAGAVASMKTREFDFHDAFLKLTGTAFE